MRPCSCATSRAVCHHRNSSARAPGSGHARRGGRRRAGRARLAASSPEGVRPMTNEALRTILPIAGWGEDRARAVELTGGTDPILPTPFRIAETSTAALAAVGLAVDDLWA